MTSDKPVPSEGSEAREGETNVATQKTCENDAATQVRINSCIYPKLKITPTFTLTLLLEIGSKG